VEGSLSTTIETLIQLDVQRSFQCSKIIKQEALLSLLKVYAQTNVEVQYCQGMNFIAGFVLLLSKDEELAFKFMYCFIEKYKMQNLFVQNVPLLKKSFYVLDRLISSLYPDISDFFRTKGISSSFFASNWIMTLFAQSTQYIKNDVPTPFLMKVWDYLLLDGWKAIFKAALFIINEMKEKFIGAQFDKVISLFSDFTKTKHLHDESTAKKFQENYKKIKVTNTTLEILTKEYSDMYKDVIECLK